MNCTNIRPLLSFYIDDEVTPEERAQVEYHLAHCEACKRQMAEYRAMRGEIRAMPLPMPPAALRRDVWRAIEAKQASPRIFSGTPVRDRIATPPRTQAQRGPSLITVFTSMGSNWARAIPAALLVAVLLIGLTVLIYRPPVTPAAAEIIEKGEIVDYAQSVHVKFNTQVNHSEAQAYTSVRRLDGSTPYTVSVSSEFKSDTDLLVLKPEATWEPGATYEVYIDCPKIGRGVGNEKMSDKPLPLRFSAAVHTPTPTNTPTDTPSPTDTPIPPTNTPGPAVAQNSPTKPVVGPPGTPVTTKVANITPSTKASATPVLNPTNTQLPGSPTMATLPTSTTEPTRVAPPTSTPQPTHTAIILATPTTRSIPTATATAVVPTNTAIPVRSTASATATLPRSTSTPTATPGERVTPSPTQPCSTMPVRGFGKIWKTNTQVKSKVGCPTGTEADIPQAAQQRFENGLMFWRGDTHTIYVFVGAQNDSYGVWHQFADTWQDTDPTPQPTKAPAGLLEPVRGFGKVWRNNPEIRQQLGWAIEQEWNITAAWQTYERGYALWTSDKVIRFMYADGIYARFDDTYTDSSAGE